MAEIKKIGPDKCHAVDPQRLGECPGVELLIGKYEQGVPRSAPKLTG